MANIMMITKTVLKDYVERLTSITICNIAAIGAIRLCETAFSTYYTGEFTKHLTSNVKGFFFDICYLLIFTIIAFPRRDKKKPADLFRWTMAAIITVSMLLVGFFAQSGFPLDRLIFVYTFDEIVETLTASNSTTWWIYACILAIPAAYLALSKRQYKTGLATKAVVASLLLSGLIVRISAYDNSAKNRNFAEESNKIGFFLRSSATLLNGEMAENELNVGQVNEFQSLFPHHQFISERTPFLHKDNSENTLAPFFDLGDKKPNIVIVCVEGLGRENSGTNSKYASATPFLDSLAKESLSWQNCLSTSQRTVSALPSILGALPFGTYGFMAMKSDAPEFHSLPRILEKNGYKFSFYYGGWGDFDDMGTFITLNNGSQYFEKKFDKSVPRNDWGLYDKFVFEEAVKRIDFSDSSPRLDFYLTLTSHTPWDYPDKDSYIERYKETCKAQGKPENTEYAAAASYLYVDEAIRQLIDRYSEKPGFDNTIFIITGDHNFKDYTFILERYHVPLIIWSPMLKTSKDIKAVVSHRDITPALLALLKGKYDITSPQNVTWLNVGLDTAENFRSLLFSPQIDLSRELKLLVTNEYYIYGDEVYRFNFDNGAIGLTPIDNTALCDSLRHLQKLYRGLDYFVCKNDALINKYMIRNVEQIANINMSDETDSTTVRGEYTNICNLPLTTKHDILHIKFRCRRKTPTMSPMALVFEINSKDGDNLMYESCEMPVHANPQWSDFDYERNIGVAKLYEKGSVLKIYIWNKEKAEQYLTDMEANISNIH